LRYSVGRPTLARAAFGVLRQSQSRRTVRSLIRIQNQLRVSLALGRTHQMVLDEWFIHEAWLVVAESRRVKISDVEPVLRSVSTGLAAIPRLLVRLTVSPAVAAARVLSREQVTWFQERSYADLVSLFDQAHASMNVLCSSSRGDSTPVVTLDTSESTPAAIVDELLPRIRTFP
jgi:hypothetical protein